MLKPQLYLILACVVPLASCQPPEAETRPQGPSVLSPELELNALTKVSYKMHVQPILQERCYHCHSSENASAGWNMEDVNQFYLKGKMGRRVLPFHPESSLMIQFIEKGNHAHSMPAVGNPPTENEIAILTKWVKSGAKTEH